MIGELLKRYEVLTHGNLAHHRDDVYRHAHLAEAIDVLIERRVPQVGADNGHIELAAIKVRHQINEVTTRPAGSGFHDLSDTESGHGGKNSEMMEQQLYEDTRPTNCVCPYEAHVREGAFSTLTCVYHAE